MREDRFKHEQRELAVRAEIADNEVLVRVYEGTEPATAVTYRVTIETVFDVTLTGIPVGLVDELMDLAKDDVLSGRVPLRRPARG